MQTAPSADPPEKKQSDKTDAIRRNLMRTDAYLEEDFDDLLEDGEET